MPVDPHNDHAICDEEIDRLRRLAQEYEADITRLDERIRELEQEHAEPSANEWDTYQHNVKLEQQLTAAQERLARLVEFLGDAVAWIRILTDENPLTPTGEALLTKWDTALKEEYFATHSKEKSERK